MQIVAHTSQLTMSTREIADLIGKKHSNIKISAERLCERGVIGTLAAQEFEHNGNSYFEYRLCKRDSLILVAQNCPEFTAAIVDRWQELEDQLAAPALPDFTNPVAAARAWADAKEAEQAALIQLEAAKPAVEFVQRYTEARSSKSLSDVAKVLGQKPQAFIAKLADEGIIFRRGGSWVPFQQHIDAGRFSVKTGEMHGHAYIQTRVEPKGVEWLARFYGGAQ